MPYFSEDAEVLRPLAVFAISADLGWDDLDFPREAATLADGFSARCGTPGAFDLFCVSNVNAPMGLVWHIHGHPKKGKLQTMRAILRRKPAKMPPPYVLNSHKMVQERGGIMRFFEALGKQERLCDAEVEFGLKSQKSLQITPRRMSNLPAGFKLGAQKFTLHRDNETHVEISFLKGNSSIGGRSKIPIPVTENCFDKAAEVIWDIIKPLFKANE